MINTRLTVIKKDADMYGLDALLTFVIIGVSLIAFIIYILVVWGISRKQKEGFNPLHFLPLLIVIILAELITR